ncbi:acetyltransferase [Sporosarcina globispora]|uniref:Acetyltransferase n=1 Tax=Sporosarcina globispora TaxID=1459 RepID=A0A0M0GGD7_SPOGL|nr:acetyltransferase [Sporosarcina globispora]KON88960.1 acetyltransferase [Sporosarcina globispora]
MDKTFLKYDFFKNINLDDPFFDSLKSDYKEFEAWFIKKQNNKAYYYENEHGIQAFLYLKIENEELNNIEPRHPEKERIKIGTLKINSRGTKLGERFIKKAIDYAVVNSIKELYVTVFPKHEILIKLLEKYGFTCDAVKHTENGTENVYFKSLDIIKGDPLLDYPLVNIKNNKTYLLGIKPEYHTLLFPDSILTNESFDLIQDVSHTNSIHKVYICFMPQARSLEPGDGIVIYRMSDNQGPAEYRSVATSICVLDEVKTKSDFLNFDEYYDYCKKHSVFTESELRSLFIKNNLFVLKMTYNLAMEKKLIRRTLADDCGLNRNDRWGLLSIGKSQFNKIVELGGINESFIID